MVITPIVTGQILSRTSHSIGAIVVAAWNFVTVFMEYYLLWKIYQEVPQLQRDKVKGKLSGFEVYKQKFTLFIIMFIMCVNFTHQMAMPCLVDKAVNL